MNDYIQFLEDKVKALEERLKNYQGFSPYRIIKDGAIPIFNEYQHAFPVIKIIDTYAKAEDYGYHFIMKSSQNGEVHFSYYINDPFIDSSTFKIAMSQMLRLLCENFYQDLVYKEKKK